MGLVLMRGSWQIGQPPRLSLNSPSHAGRGRVNCLNQAVENAIGSKRSVLNPGDALPSPVAGPGLAQAASLHFSRALLVIVTFYNTEIGYCVSVPLGEIIDL